MTHVIKKKISSILQENQRKGEVRNLKSGSIDVKNLHRYPTSGRIFKTKSIGGKDYNISVLIDLSGSMRYIGKIEALMILAPSVISILNSTFNKVEVIAFNCVTEVLQDINEKLTVDEITRKLKKTWDDANEEDKNGNQKCSGTHDWVAIDKARESLMTTEGKKFIMTLSDGAPNCDYYGNVCPFNPHETTNLNIPTLRDKLRKEIDKAKKQGIECFGVGILTDSVSKYYPNYYVVNDLSDFNTGFLTFLRKFVRKVEV